MIFSDSFYILSVVVTWLDIQIAFNTVTVDLYICDL